MIEIEGHDFTQDVPIIGENEERFIAYCGRRELPVMATFNIKESMFYTLSGKMLLGVTLWFKVPTAKRIWLNLEKEI